MKRRLTILRNAVGCTVMLFLFVLIAPADSPKGNISGKVLRKTDKKPLYDATVKVKGTDKTTHTDKDGVYTFKSVDADKDYTLLMSKEPLYDDGQTTVNVKAKTTAQASDVELERNPANLRRIGELINLLDSQDFQKFEMTFNIFRKQCQGIDNNDCRLIKQIDEEFHKRDLRIVRLKLDKLLEGSKAQFKPDK